MRISFEINDATAEELHAFARALAATTAVTPVYASVRDTIEKNLTVGAIGRPAQQQQEAATYPSPRKQSEPDQADNSQPEPSPEPEKPTEPAEPKRGRGRPPKAPEAEKPAEQTAAPETAAKEPEKANGSDDKPATSDDLRAAFRAYSAAYGAAILAEDGPKILKAVAPSAAQIVDVPTDLLPAAIAAVTVAINENPYKRARV